MIKIIVLLVFIFSCAKKEDQSVNQTIVSKSKSSVEPEQKEIKNQKEIPTNNDLKKMFGRYESKNYKVTISGENSGEFWGYYFVDEVGYAYHKTKIKKIIQIDSAQINFEFFDYYYFSDEKLTDTLGVMNAEGYYAVYETDGALLLYNDEYDAPLATLKRIK